MMQEYCRLLGVGASEAELSDLAATIGALSSDHPIAGVARRTKDFRHPDALADALLHPQDRAYTVPQLYAWLERCGLSFGRWFEQAPYLPQCGAIAGTPHATHLASLSPPMQHAAVELLRGTMTKHDFIAYRDDRPGESQTITFGGDAWRGDVPLRLPWTLCIRDRVPPGSVAVLINRAHTYPDLALPIDAEQEQIFAAIDGKRSIDELLRRALRAGAMSRLADLSSNYGSMIRSCSTRRAHADQQLVRIRRLRASSSPDITSLLLGWARVLWRHRSISPR
jgi:hypothetical protein